MGGSAPRHRQGLGGARNRVRRTATVVCLATGCVALCRGLLSPLRCYTVPPTFGKYKLDINKALGSGAYGSVYQCEDNKGVTRAVKVIPMWRMQLDDNREQTRAELEHEIEVHQHIGAHDNVVQLVDSIDVAGDVDDWPRWKMIVMEIAKGGELSDLVEKVGKLPENKAKHILKQVVAAMQHLHKQKVIHRDLKLDNILLCTESGSDPEKPHVKLIDFGAGHWAKEGPMEASTCTGTLETMAPEVILSRGDEFDAHDQDSIDSAHEIEFRVRPFGVRKYAPGPNGIGARVIEIIDKERYKGDPLGQAWKKGVRNGWIIKSVGGKDVRDLPFDDILDLMGDRLLDNSSRGAFDGSFKVSGDNKGKGKVLPKVEMVDLPATVEYLELKQRKYGSKVDVWSLGCVLYNMVAGTPPFPAEEPAIRKGEYPPIAGASPELTDLLSKMINVDPDARLDMNGVAAHPWLA